MANWASTSYVIEGSKEDVIKVYQVIDDFMEGQVEAKVMAVKYPITEYSGILIMLDEDREYYEVGWANLLQEDVTNILDALPNES